MSANEIAERLAASAWVQCGSAGGEAVNALANNQIRFRSNVGFQQRIITTTDANAFPLLILPLDRTLNRNECAVFACRHGTQGPGATMTDRSVYPFLTEPVPDVPQVFVQPILLEWLGPDLSAPQFYPFGLVVGVIPTAPPVGANLDLFDAVAVLLPVPIANASSGDFSVLVLKHPPREGDTTIQAVMPVPAPGP